MNLRLSALLLVCAVCPAIVSAAQARPNILWITSEDNGPELGCYGDRYATTPRLDAFAERSLRYRTCWSNAPVCAPARTTIITGVYPPATGAQHMRSNVPMPSFMRMYPEILREAGYYCTNNSKTDYNLIATNTVWDESSRKAHWKNRKKNQPFFAIFNHTISHESQIRNRIQAASQIHDPAQVRVRAYHPDTPEVRKDWAQYYDRLTMMDARVGANLDELEAAGLADETIVFYYGDHGSGMPRSKRWPYNSGEHVPLIVHIPEKFKHLRPDEYETGGESDRLTSFVDLAPTLLSLIGQKPPEWMQGHAFAGKYDAGPQPFVYGYRGRMDERYDMVRSVRDQRYVYIRNYMPHKVYGQYIQYMFQTPTTRVWKELYDAGRLNAAQSLFWQTKPVEELYDLASDPDEVVNLADSREHQDIRERLARAQRGLALKIRDLGFLPEGTIHARGAASSPYEYGQSAAYDLERLMDIADRASALDPEHTGSLITALSADDSAVRYWAAMGLLMREQSGVEAGRAALRMALQDQATPARIIAAQALAQWGNAEDVQLAIPVLLSAAPIDRNDVYTSMLALNAFDAIDGRAASVLEELAQMPKNGKVPPRMGAYVKNLLTKTLSDLQKPSRP